MDMTTLRRILTTTALAVAVCGLASANSIVVPCGTGAYSQSAGSGFESGAVTENPTFLTCAGFAALPVGDTFIDGQIILQTDFTGGFGTTTNTVVTNFTGIISDVLTATSAPGTGGSESYTSNNQGAPNYPSIGNNFFEELATSITASNYTSTWGTETPSVNITTGTVQGTSGQVFEVLDYSVTSGTPEPATMALFGGALMGLGLIGKRLKKS
jgi:hypothetical protein